jgi:hypothetical protein
MSTQRIIFARQDGGVSVFVPNSDSSLTIDEWAAMVVPQGSVWRVVDVGQISSDREFRNAWAFDGDRISVDITKAKEIAHAKRRAMRSKEFEPHDDVISKQIPGRGVEEAEAARSVIRAKYEAMQSEIDAADSVYALKVAMGAA